MLNSLTIRRRTELRRLRSLLLSALIAATVLGALLLCGGLWHHNLLVAAAALPAFPAARHLRGRLASVRRVLRLLGA